MPKITQKLGFFLYFESTYKKLSGINVTCWLILPSPPLLLPGSSQGPGAPAFVSPPPGALGLTRANSCCASTEITQGAREGRQPGGGFIVEGQDIWNVICSVATATRGCGGSSRRCG